MAQLAHRIITVPITRKHFSFYVESVQLSKPLKSDDFKTWENEHTFSQKMVQRMKYQGVVGYERILSLWDSIKTAPPTTFKGKIYTWTEKLLLNRISPCETFLTNIELPPLQNSLYDPLPPIKIVVPSVLSHSEVEIYLTEFLEKRINYHKRRLLLNVLLLPITFIIFLIPGPANFPFYINIYRTYCNWKAKRAAEYLHLQIENAGLVHTLPDDYPDHVTPPHPEGITDAESTEVKEDTFWNNITAPVNSLPGVKVEFEDSLKLTSILGDQFFSTPNEVISDSQIEILEKEFKMEDLSQHLLRWKKNYHKY